MEKLLIFRNALDELDEQVMALLARRFEVCRQVAAYKAEANIPMMQPGRVAEVKTRAAARAKSAGLSEEFGLQLYGLIIGEACRLEDEIIENAQSLSLHI